MAELHYSKQAVKYLKRMPKGYAKKMHQALKRISHDDESGLNIKWMASLNAYRLRQGNYRAQYEFLNDHERMVVGKIGIRGDFYK